LNRILSIEKLDRYGRVTEYAPEQLDASLSDKNRTADGMETELPPSEYSEGGSSFGPSRRRRKPGRMRVTLENGELFNISERKAIDLGLETGGEMTQEIHEEILSDLRRSCMQRCGALLGSRDYTVKRLRIKLEEAGFPPSIIEECIEKLTDAHYLDDRRYAQNYVRSYINDRSRRRIAQDLLGRGIAENMIEEAFASVGEETDPEEAQIRQIRRLLKKRDFDPAAATFEEKQKIMAFLHRKGYEADLIHREMEESSDL
jgi:regulatory protein